MPASAALPVVCSTDHSTPVSVTGFPVSETTVAVSRAASGRRAAVLRTRSLKVRHRARHPGVSAEQAHLGICRPAQRGPATAAAAGPAPPRGLSS